MGIKFFSISVFVPLSVFLLFQNQDILVVDK